MHQTARQIYRHLKDAEKILIVPHQNSDGDALGSLSALTEHLITLGHKPCLFCITPVPKKFEFLRHINKVTTDPEIFKDQGIDTIVVLDSGDLRYAGIAKHLTDSDAKIINFDHHPTNDKYGHLNMIMPGAASTTEVLFYFFKDNNIPINNHIATSLLTGIVTDTDNFTNPATSTSALRVASELLRRGGNLNLINKWVVKNKTINTLKLWGAVLSRLDKEETKGIIYTYITKEDLKKHDVGETEAEGIANFLNNLEGAKISLILRETEDEKIKVSFRTTRDDIDVSTMAKKFGGGGHKKAAGFTIDGEIEKILQMILTDN